MTPNLQDAVERAAELPKSRQDEIAAVIRREIETERSWQAGFDSSVELLDRLADEAHEEHRAGRTTPLDFESR